MNQEYEKMLQELKNYKDEELVEKLCNIQDTVQIPEKLYRYRPAYEYTVDEIKDQYVYMNSPQSDDKFDTQIVISGDEAQGMLAAYRLTKHLPGMEKDHKEYEKILSRYNQILWQTIKISCFTETNTNIPMWYYYAGKHEGICIEYSIDKSKIEKDGEINMFLPVIYTNDFNKYFIDQLHDDVGMGVTAIVSSILKMEDWSFEKEWRLVSYGIDTPSRIPVEMSAIYFGLYTSEKFKASIKEAVKATNKNIPLYQAKVTLTGLEYERIPQ